MVYRFKPRNKNLWDQESHRVRMAPHSQVNNFSKTSISTRTGEAGNQHLYTPPTPMALAHPPTLQSAGTIYTARVKRPQVHHFDNESGTHISTQAFLHPADVGSPCRNLQIEAGGRWIFPLLQRPLWGLGPQRETSDSIIEHQGVLLCSVSYSCHTPPISDLTGRYPFVTRILIGCRIALRGIIYTRESASLRATVSYNEHREKKNYYHEKIFMYDGNIPEYGPSAILTTCTSKVPNDNCFRTFNLRTQGHQLCPARSSAGYPSW